MLIGLDPSRNVKRNHKHAKKTLSLDAGSGKVGNFIVS